MLKEFKAFITGGNVVDLAVGVIIGAAVGVIVSSLVADVIMPPVGLAFGEVDFSHFLVVLKHGTPPGPYATVAAAQAAGAVTLNYGRFIGTIITFLITATAVFFFVVKPIIKLRTLKKADTTVVPATKECPFCYTNIFIKATRCPNCTSQLEQI